MPGRGGTPASDGDLAQLVRGLEERVDQLEQQLEARLVELAEGLQEQRCLSQRVAALGDFVAEVVSATVRSDRAELDAALAKYSDDL